MEGFECADCKRHCQLHMQETEQRSWLSSEVLWQRPAHLLRQFTYTFWACFQTESGVNAAPQARTGLENWLCSPFLSEQQAKMLG